MLLFQLLQELCDHYMNRNEGIPCVVASVHCNQGRGSNSEPDLSSWPYAYLSLLLYACVSDLPILTPFIRKYFKAPWTFGQARMTFSRQTA